MPDPAAQMDFVYLNRVAQKILPIEDALTTFDAITDPTEKQSVMRRLVLMVDQSHPTLEEIRAGIQASGLKADYTPCVMLAAVDSPASSRLREQLGK
jgi:hypothetical protein